jgi:hypothetical protein
MALAHVYRRPLSLLWVMVMMCSAVALDAATPRSAEATAPARLPDETGRVNGDVGQKLIPFEAINSANLADGGDRLSVPRRIAAAIVAQDNPAPKLIVDVGAYTGEFLEAFLVQFPKSHGQWTEPVEKNHPTAIRRLARFGRRVDFRIGCPGRDLSDGCVPAGTDVLITSWLSIHQNLDGIRKYYRQAAALLPSGGWLANLDHVGFGGNAWERRIQRARVPFHATFEGPPVHHEDFRTPTLDEQLAALKAAGIDDVEVVWRSLDTVLIMGRKH